METIYRAYKYRIYPNKEQIVLINKHIGSCRWIYNYALEKKVKAYKKDKTKLGRFQIQSDLPKLKKLKQTMWLKEVNSQSLQAELEHMDNAFVRFSEKRKASQSLKASTIQENLSQFHRASRLIGRTKEYPFPK